MLRNRAKRKYGTVAQEIQFSEFYRTAIKVFTKSRESDLTPYDVSAHIKWCEMTLPGARDDFSV